MKTLNFYLFREIIVSMEDHDEKRRQCEPETWNLQKHLIVDFIQNVMRQVLLQSLMILVLSRNVASEKHLLRHTSGK